MVRVWILTCVMLAGCDGLFASKPEVSKRQLDGRAVGAACRHAARALEDCYVLTPKSAKAYILEGWLTMDAYMRENKIEPVVPVLPRLEPQQEKESQSPPPKGGGLRSNCFLSLRLTRPSSRVGHKHCKLIQRSDGYGYARIATNKGEAR